jgi:hypothetical protein
MADGIRSRVQTKEWDEGWERVFGEARRRREREEKELQKLLDEELSRPGEVVRRPWN